MSRRSPDISQVLPLIPVCHILFHFSESGYAPLPKAARRSLPVPKAARLRNASKTGPSQVRLHFDGHHVNARPE
jgi:hypothetical protein